jgi:hypothetical protein
MGLSCAVLKFAFVPAGASNAGAEGRHQGDINCAVAVDVPVELEVGKGVRPREITRVEMDHERTSENQ